MNSKAKLQMRLKNNGSVITKVIDKETDIYDIEKLFINFVQEKINEVFQNTSWDIGVTYQSDNSIIWTHKWFSKYQLEDAVKFLEEQNKCK